MSAPAVIAPARGAQLVVLPHPLTLEGRTITHLAAARPGDTLLDWLDAAGLDLAPGQWSVSISGARVPAAMLARLRPHEGQIIELRREAHEEVVRAAAFIALVYVTLQTGMPASALGITDAFAAFAVNAAVFMAGSMLINKLLPPTVPGLGVYSEQTQSQTYALAGGRNRMRPYEPLPLLFGTTKVVPDFAAQPFAWFEGDDQYQYVRLHAGLNAGTVSALKIGTTDIASFTDLEVRKTGFPGVTDQLTEWSSVDTIAGATLTAPTAPGAYVTRTSSVSSVRLAIDLMASLYDMADDGSFSEATLTIEAEKRLLPAGAWSALSPDGTSLVLKSSGTTPVRKTVVSATLAAGQYEVRVRKMTADVSTTRAANSIDWSTLKSYQVDTADYSYQPQVGIRVKASGQLNGVLDQVNWIGQAADEPLWTGSAWTNTATSNPGAHILRFARGFYDDDGRLIAGLGLPDSQIDIETLKSFMVHCAANGYTFDHWFDTALSCQDALESIANAGMGSISWHPGKLSVVWAASGQPIEAVVSMGSIKQGTFRVDYATRSSADEIEVTYFDSANDYQSASVRILAPGVYAPRETARLSPAGVKTQAQAIQRGRFAMAQNIYQRKVVTWEMDLEHLSFRRFSVVALSHDMTQWGYSGRLKAAANASGTITITLDDEVPFNPSAAARRVGLRIPGETGYRIFQVATFSGTSRTLTLVGAWPGGVPLPGDSASNPAWDTTWIYDFKASPGKRLRVTGIEPAAGMTGARITAVPEDDEFWTYMSTGDYVVPAGTAPPRTLAAANVRVTQGRLDLNYDFSASLDITFDVTGPYDHAEVWGAVGAEPLRRLGSTRTTSFPGWIVRSTDTVSVKVVPFDELGRVGAEATASHTVDLDAASLVEGAATTATWTGVASRPANLAALAGTEAINNALVGSNLLWKVSSANAAAGTYGTLLDKLRWSGADTDSYGFKAGEALTISADLWCDAACLAAGQNSTIILWCQRSDGNWTSTASATVASTTASRVSASLTLPASLSDMWGIGVTLFHQGTNAASSPTGTVFCDRVQVERGPVATQYHAGAQPGATLGAIWGSNVQGSATVDAAIAAAQTAANNANTALANIASDSILSPGEKPSVVQDYAVITGEQSGIDAAATAYGITSEKTAYDGAVSALTSYLGGLSGWNTIPGSDVAIVGTTFRTKFGDVYAARQTLLNKIAAVAGTVSTWAGVSGSGKPADNATVGAPSGTNVGATAATTVESNAAAGASAYTAVNDGSTGLSARLKKAGDTITGTISLGVAQAILVGSTSDGLYLGNNGLTVKKAGATMLAADAAGNVTFAGSLAAASGTFAGNLSAAGGTFAGTLTAAAINAVDTINVAGSALVAPVAGSFSGVASNSQPGVSSKTTTITIGSITTSAYGDGRVLLLIAPTGTPNDPNDFALAYLAKAWFSGNGYNTTFTWKVKRNGTVIRTRTTSYNTGSGTPSLIDLPTMIFDTPGAGVACTYTYEMTTSQSSTTNMRHEILDGAYVLIEFKK